MLINPNNPNYHLGISTMDETHDEFIELVNRMQSTTDAEFTDLFRQLVQHTKAHFAAENALMEQSGFPPIQIHMSEHERVLGDLHRMGLRVDNGAMDFPRAYVEQQIPDWFDLHARTMDSALAAHLGAIRFAGERKLSM